VAADLHGGSGQRQALLCGWGHVWEFWAYTDERVPRKAFDAVQWHDALHRVLARIKDPWMGEERSRSLRSTPASAPAIQPVTTVR